MGGDSAGVDGSYNMIVGKQPKVFRNGPFLIGYTTSFRMGQLLQYGSRLPIPKDDADLHGFMVSYFIESVRKLFESSGFSTVENNRHSGGEFLVGINGRLFKIESDYQVLEPSNGMAACGCGAPYALGALWGINPSSAGYRIEMALTAAQEFSAGVRSPFHIQVAP